MPSGALVGELRVGDNRLHDDDLRRLSFKRHRFDRLVTVLCVRWHVSYKLSYQDLVEMMADRGLSMAHTTTMRWVLKRVPTIEQR